MKAHGAPHLVKERRFTGMPPLSLTESLRSLSQDPMVFVAGGPVRDRLLGRQVLDVDLVVPNQAVALARRFADDTDGHFVLLDEMEGVARVITPQLALDFSQFRGGVATLDEDLAQRDFTVNAMAVPLAVVLTVILSSAEYQAEAENNHRGAEPLPNSRREMAIQRITDSLIDPLGGLADLQNGIIRAIGRANLQADPLRLLRAYRFEAQLGFEIEARTRAWIVELAPTIARVSAERISHELDLIMTSNTAGSVLEQMVHDGPLLSLLPEMRPMGGLEQPGFHHLDCLHHSLVAVQAMEALLREPGRAFPLAGPFEAWIAREETEIGWLKWATLLHDLGKPPCLGEKAGRPTFYQHEQSGAEMTVAIGRRLRWPRRETEFVARLVRLHMRPFHLLPVVRRGGPSRRAMRRLLKEVGPDYPALFLLAMADSLAGCGPLKPPDVDANLAVLWERIHHFYETRMQPVELQPRLLNGHDIQKVFGLHPGPIIGEALDALEEAQVEGEIYDRQSALAWMRTWLEDKEL